MMRRHISLILILYIILSLFTNCMPYNNKKSGDNNDNGFYDDNLSDAGNTTFESMVLDDFEEFDGDFSAKYHWYRDSSHNGLPVIQNDYVYHKNYAVEFNNKGKDNSYSFMEIDVIATENTDLNFYYKVSTEYKYDYLRFYIDNNKIKSWSGLIDWSLFKIRIKKGKHTLRWEYRKDLNNSNNLDKVWIDYIFSDIPLQYVSLEYNLNIEIDGNGTVEIEPDKDFYLKGEKVTINAVNKEDNIFYRWVGDSIEYENKQDVNMLGDKTIKAIFLEKSYLTNNLEENWENGSFNNYNWILGGDNLPFIQNIESYHGQYALQFGDIGNDQISYLEIPVFLNCEAVLSFYTKIDCESGYYNFFDGLKFYVNDMTNPIIKWDSDDADLWTEYKNNLKSGFNVLRWEYSKNETYYENNDTAWVDNIYIIGSSPEISVKEVKNDGIYIENALVNDNGDPPIEKNITFHIENKGFSVLEIGNISVSNPIFSINENPSYESLEPGDTTELNINVLPYTTIEYSTYIKIPTNDPLISSYIYQVKIIGVKENEGYLFMMYMGGDNNLESALWGDINEMEYGLSLLDKNMIDKFKVVVLWDGYQGYSPNLPEGGMLYELAPDSKLNFELSLDTIILENAWFYQGNEIDTGSGETLENFINYCDENYQGLKNKVLIMSGHGQGVRDDISRKGLNDEGNNSALYTNEIQQAINNAIDENKLSIIGYDSCIMANIEEAYEYRLQADYFIASPEDEFGDGWEYHDLFTRINRATTPEELSRKIVYSFRDSVGGIQTLTAVDLRKMVSLKNKIDNLSQLLYQNLSVYDIKKILSETEVSGNNSLYLGDFLTKIMLTEDISSEIIFYTEEVFDDFKSSILYSWSGPYNAGPYDGIGDISGEGLVIEQTPHKWYTSEPYYDHGSIDFCTSTNDGVINTWKELIFKLFN